MIANPTTLILGAGASEPFGYPVGMQLRKDIIQGKGVEDYLESLNIPDRDGSGEAERQRYGKFKGHFDLSHVASIDAFLAEPENKEFADVGRIAIAAALLPCEHLSPSKPSDWYGDLFNAIRTRPDATRRHKLKVVTFNYDLSLEFFLVRAFQYTYGLSPELARAMFHEHVEINHVYGTLGEISELTDNARTYGEARIRVEVIRDAASRIHIIERDKEQTRDAFAKAFAAIADAAFIGILGYGFDPLNNENLRLQEAAGEKKPFATGYGLGAGARARLTRLVNRSAMVMGGKGESVKGFLDETDFLRWINEPNATAGRLVMDIGTVFKGSMLPYQR